MKGPVAALGPTSTIREQTEIGQNHSASVHALLTFNADRGLPGVWNLERLHQPRISDAGSAASCAP